MASGHDVPKPRTEFSHQSRRRVDRETLTTPKRKTFQGVPLHQLSNDIYPGQAYGETQTSDKIKMGDLLEIPGEGVSGYLHAAWPIATTRETAGLHTLTDPETGPSHPDPDSGPNEPNYQQRWQSAKALQKKRGYA